MKQRSTDQLLTLGMALTTDRRTMERRVRGVFARKRSAKGVLALSALLVFAGVCRVYDGLPAGGSRGRAGQDTRRSAGGEAIRIISALSNAGRAKALYLGAGWC